MTITERTKDGIAILELQGSILLGNGDTLLREHVSRLLAQGSRGVVFNLAGVPYVDSSGLGEIVRAMTSIKRAGGRLKLASPSRRLVDILNITKLSSILETYDTEEAAVASFQAAS
ncbi:MULTISPECIES: STAS domain-containing protein [Chloracidobacterium]|jgi:anti-sigma B factor antagonist|uniref:Anti-sigma factor antagonist n=2 Tax=Chloracidobacterium TaxID=458032 RepID=G2LG83_CHLTF|nr:MULTISPECIES: STAS domain-containing protein [Chloracidobacterium]AEP12596.1 anti-anti-sigma factor [Chloracidobacterium thermophilum B]QUV78342.1 STAS domain-containing protein [Chloracidobacterium thermophilum]QUV81381.1 STAS domain-containing protein [Chloracidobacterium sp. D]QUV84113.1 STAS domain-containing protein [Chloracidobacterium sp. 2]QUV87402.1 STAS domain-containing protein [Chloracidobacterium sp. S]